MESSNIDIESQALEIVFVNQKNVMLLNVYCRNLPPQGKVDNVATFLEQGINIIDLDKKDLFILGDFNINFLEKSDLNTKKLDWIIAQLGLAKTISTPTHFGNVTHSCID